MTEVCYPFYDVLSIEFESLCAWNEYYNRGLHYPVKIVTLDIYGAMKQEREVNINSFIYFRYVEYDGLIEIIETSLVNHGIGVKK